MNHELLIETANPADIAMIKSLLDAEGIVYFAQGEAFHAVRPTIEPVRFMVAEDQLEIARELIAGLRLSYGTVTSTSDLNDETESGDG